MGCTSSKNPDGGTTPSQEGKQKPARKDSTVSDLVRRRSTQNITPYYIFSSDNTGTTTQRERKECIQSSGLSEKEYQKLYLSSHHSRTYSQKECETIRQSLLHSKINFLVESLTENELQSFIHEMELIQIPADTKIIRQDDAIGDYFYILKSGKIRFFIDGNHVRSVEIHHENKEGAKKNTTFASFGEVALLYNCPRTATVLTEGPCELWRIDQTKFRSIVTYYQKHAETQVLQNLQRVSDLKDWKEEHLHLLLDAFSEVRYKRNKTWDVEVRNVFSFLQRGSVKLGEKVYTENEWFGEEALATTSINIMEKSADVKEVVVQATALTEEVVLLQVTHDQFKKIEQARMKLCLLAIPSVVKCNLTDFDIEFMMSLLNETHFPPDKSIYRIDYDSSSKNKVCSIKEPILFIVRSGAIQYKKSTSGKGDKIKILTSGDYFGEDTFVTAQVADDQVTSTVTVTTTQDTKCYILKVKALNVAVPTLYEFATGREIHHHHSTKEDFYKLFNMSNLQKHVLLGIGTFGQVWLVSSKDDTGESYALKTQSKRLVLRSSPPSYDSILRKLRILKSIYHPFVMHLHTSFQDDTYLYYVMQFYQGGELYNIIYSRHDYITGKKKSRRGKRGRFGIQEPQAKFYAACILEALCYLHHKHIVYRNLMPENVMIDRHGYCVLVDMGFTKVISGKTYTVCGNPAYLAPEVILQRGHKCSVDLWTLGIMIYEMILGDTPFFKAPMDNITLFKNICKGTFTYPDDDTYCSIYSSDSDSDSDDNFLNKKPVITSEAQWLINSLLAFQPSQRLGALSHGVRYNDIRHHAWFDNLPFLDLCKKKIEAPWRPSAKNALDCRYFEKLGDGALRDMFSDLKELSEEEQKVFENFSK